MKGIQDGTSAEDRFKETAMRDEIDAKMGFERMEVGPPREACEWHGWQACEGPAH